MSPNTASERVRAPAVVAVLFWISVTLSAANAVLDAGLPPLMADEPGVDIGRLVGSVAAVCVVIVCWRHLPWTPAAGRRLLPPLFALSSLVLGLLTGMTWSQGLLLVATANTVFSLGMRRGFLLVLGLFPAVGFALLLSFRNEISAGEAAFRSATLVIVAAFVVGASGAIVEARRDRAVAAALLSELRTRSDKVAELSAAAERARLTRDIHDSVGHHLTVANLQLLAADRLRRSDAEAAWAEVSAARSSVQTAVREVRASVRALGPTSTPVERGGSLPDALAVLLSGQDGGATTSRLTVVGAPRPSTPETSMLVYRAVQEGVTNAAKHGDPDQVTVALAYTDDEVVVLVEDAGKGEAATSTPAFGFGLASLDARARELGGSLVVTRSSDGFQLRVAVPTTGIS